MRSGVALGGIVSPVIFSLYVYMYVWMDGCERYAHTFAPRRAVCLRDWNGRQSHVPTLIFSYLEIYPNRPQRWLREVVEGHGVPTNTAVLSVKTAKCIQRLPPIQVFEVPTQCGGTTPYLEGNPPYTTQLVELYRITLQRRQPGGNGMLGPFLNQTSGLSFIKVALLSFYKQLTFQYFWDMTLNLPMLHNNTMQYRTVGERVTQWSGVISQQNGNLCWLATTFIWRNCKGSLFISSCYSQRHTPSSAEVVGFHALLSRGSISSLLRSATLSRQPPERPQLRTRYPNYVITTFHMLLPHKSQHTSECVCWV